MKTDTMYYLRKEDLRIWGGVALDIRNHRLLVPVMDFDHHSELHRQTVIQPRSWKAGIFTHNVYDVINRQASTLGAINALLSYYDKKSHCMLTPLTIRCEAERMRTFIELQLPFLEAGMVEVE